MYFGTGSWANSTVGANNRDNFLLYRDLRYRLIRNLLSQIIFLLGLVPFGFIISIMIFYLATYDAVGYTPSYNHPDPNSLSWAEPFQSTVADWGGLWIMSLIAWIVMCIITAFITRKNLLWKPIVITLTGHLIAIWILLGPIGEWFAD